MSEHTFTGNEMVDRDTENECDRDTENEFSDGKRWPDLFFQVTIT